MKTLEYRTIDKKNWKRGEWDNEPDKVQWPDPATGYPCLIVRHGALGHLCGYVGVAKGHPAFEKGYDEVRGFPGQEYLEVHGGLTFAAECHKETRPQSENICHEVEEGDNDNIWWLGFDCAHVGDQSCMATGGHNFDGDEYRNIDYVKSECARLAEQLKASEGGES